MTMEDSPPGYAGLPMAGASASIVGCRLTSGCLN
jgi:hypothetical protein